MPPSPVLPIRIEQIPPEHAGAEPTAYLYVADDTCFRCGTRTPLLRVEPRLRDDVGSNIGDVDATTQFCPVCLEQLARRVREKIPELVGGAAPAPPFCPFEPTNMHALDLECPQRLDGGKAKTCGARVQFRFTWPGQKEQRACHAHGTLARYIAEKMGFELELIKLDPSVIDLRTDLPAAVMLEDESEVIAYDRVRVELADFKRSLDRVRPIMDTVSAAGARRVLVAALTALGFAPEFVGLFALSIDTGSGAVDPFPPPTDERH